MSTAQNKKCGKCEKVVYPAEEIKCLDKVSFSFHYDFFLFSFVLVIITF